MIRRYQHGIDLNDSSVLHFHGEKKYNLNRIHSLQLISYHVNCTSQVIGGTEFPGDLFFSSRATQCI